MKSTISRFIPSAIKHFIVGRQRGGTKSFFENVFLGQSFRVMDADDLSRTWYGKPWTRANRSEFPALEGMGLPAVGTVFDIGAHQGVVSLLLKRLIVPEGRIIAVEMDSFNAQACRENASENGETEVTCINAAISDSAGWIRHTGRSNSSISPDGFFSFLLPKTKTITINDLCSEHGVPDLIYLDVEGAEVLALKAAQKALGKTRAWFIELHGDDTCGQFDGTNADVFNVLWKAGYALKFATSEESEYVDIDRSFNHGGRGFVIGELKGD